MRNRYKIAALFLAIFFLVFLPHSNLLNQFDKAFSQQTALQKNMVEGTNTTSSPQEQKKVLDPVAKAKLLGDIEAELKDYQNYAVSIYDLNNSDSFGLNEDQLFPGASVMKVLVGTSFLRGVDQGIYKLSQPLGSATADYQLQQMVNQSNNYSWDFFNNLLGFSLEQQTVTNLGINGIAVNQNKMSTRGTEELLLKLYNGQALTTASRDKLFGYMQNTEDENRISTAIPSGVTFYHKTGYYLGAINDAAIVIHPKNPFILVIFTDDETGHFAEKVRFSSFKIVTQKVYQYFDSI